LQIAPILFLQIEKFFSTIVPNSEIGLRLFPFLCYSFSLILFYKIVLILFKNHFLIILALSLFVFNESLIIFSSQVKQYICDVMVINMILYFCLKDFSKIEKRFLVLAIVGVVSIYISNASIVILFCAGLYLFVDFAILSRIFISRVLVTILIWSVAFGIYYFLFINGHESINQQQSNYTERRGFVAQNIFSYEFYYLL